MKQNITITRGIHKGEVTHHHDQVILFVSFKIKNTRNKTVPKPIPLLFLSFDMFLLFNRFNFFIFNFLYFPHLNVTYINR
jgi:hypothetical protein